MTTKIAWVKNPDNTTQGETWNPLTGCQRHSAGCGDASGGGCYAERLAGTRLAHLPAYAGLTRATPQGPRWIGKVHFDSEKLSVPLRRRKPTGYFVCDMGDLFHDGVTDEQIDSVFAVMALTQRHRYYLLTKRAARMADYLASRAKSSRFWEAACPSGWALRWEGLPLARFPLPNVWLGVSVENRATLPRLDSLRRCPAAVRFVSNEPALEDLGAVNLSGISWWISGGESGPKARPMKVEWAASLRDQCRAAGVKFFTKQFHGPGGRAISDPARFPPGDWPRELPEVKP